MSEHTDDAISRRNVLKTAGGVLAGGTLFSGRAAAAHDQSADELAESRNAWTGEYSGRSDGRRARLTITASNDKWLKIVLEDLDRNTTFSGYSQVPTGSDDHVIEDLRLTSTDGQKNVERLYRHGFDDDHVSGFSEWGGTNYGMAFASDGIEAEAGDGPRHDSDNLGQWQLEYTGRNDGREADLNILILEENGWNVKFQITLHDRETGHFFRGETVKSRSSTSHIISDVTLYSPGGETKSIDRMFLHTWDTAYVSGRTEWNGSYYGFHFAKER